MKTKEDSITRQGCQSILHPGNNKYLNSLIFPTPLN